MKFIRQLRKDTDWFSTILYTIVIGFIIVGFYSIRQRERSASGEIPYSLDVCVEEWREFWKAQGKCRELTKGLSHEEIIDSGIIKHESFGKMEEAFDNWEKCIERDVQSKVDPERKKQFQKIFDEVIKDLDEDKEKKQK